MKRKLLFIINTMGRAGAETALIGLLKKLDAIGDYDISLYTIISRGELFDRVPRNVRILNSRPSRGSVLSAGGRVAIFITTMKAFFYRFTGLRLLPYLWRNIALQKKERGRIQPDKVLWRLLAEGRPCDPVEYDLAVAFIEGGAAYYLAEKVKAKQKAAFIHIDYQKASYLPMMDRGCYNACSKIFVVSNEVGEKFTAVYPEYRDKITLFRNILDIEEVWRKAGEEAGFTDDFEGVRLVTVGRLAYQKGYDIAAEALAILKSKDYLVRWYIIGEGPERAVLERLIAKLGVSEDFVLLGAKDNPYPYVYKAQIYVHATRFEGKSIAIEEAQILRKPIIASKCTGTAEQITSGVDGLLIDLSAENLAKKLAWLIDNPEVQEEFSSNAAKRKLIFPEDLDNLLALLADESEVLGA